MTAPHFRFHPKPWLVPAHEASLAERDTQARDAVVWWWHWAMRCDSSHQWGQVSAHIHGVLMTHPDPALRAEFRTLYMVACDHADRCHAREHADIESLLAGIYILKPQAD